MPPVYQMPLHRAASRWRVGGFYAASLVIALVAVNIPALLDRNHVIDDVVRGNGLPIVAVIAVLVATAIIFAWRPSTLSVDARGIVYIAGDRAYSYAWHDIERVEAGRTGPRLFVRGQSDLRNGYNVIPVARLGLDTSALIALFDNERPHLAAGRGQVTTAPQGADAGAVEARSMRLAATVYALIAILLAALILVPAVASYRQMTALRAHGERIAGHVERFYVDSCGHSRCVTKVEYSYRVYGGGRATRFNGYGRIAWTGDDANLRLARVLNIVPLVYDTTDPASSQLNYGDVVFRSDPTRTLRLMLALSAGIIVPIVGGLYLASLVAVRARLRRLDAGS